MKAEKICKYLTVIVITLITIAAQAQTQNSQFVSTSKLPPVSYMLNNSNMGTDFWIAIPQNDVQGGQPQNVLGIYVCSDKNTKVRLEFPRLNIDRTRDLTAFEPLALTSDNGQADFSWETVNSEIVEGNAIHITSPVPVSVYVLNSRQYSSDGYMAIPTLSWGKKYVHCSYYDHFENNTASGGGFIIVAKEKNTNVTISLKGINYGTGRTIGGKNIGNVINVSLGVGDSYMVKGDGKTRATFDISGTIIESDRPIGVISFHQRTMIPNYCPNGRDHLNEMLMPVNTWGKEFVTVEFNRGGKGDFFRIVASEDDTHFESYSYDKLTGASLNGGHKEATLNAGQFWEFNNSSIVNNNKETSVMGVTVWKSNKPIQLMQYAYSYPWDNDRDWDPLMIIVPPVEQFINSAVFTTPVQAGFSTNELTVFAQGHPSDILRDLVKSVKLDGKPITDNYIRFISNKAIGTDIYWIRLNIEPGVHTLEANTKIGGYVNGFSGSDSYGWPIMTGLNKLDALDTLAPEYVLTSNTCGNCILKATEYRNGKFEDNPRQEDQGINKIVLIDQLSSNYTLSFKNPEKFNPQSGVYDYIFYLNLIDKNLPGKAVFGIVDRSGNFVMDSVEYNPPIMAHDPSLLAFGNTRLNSQKEVNYVFKNTGLTVAKITKIALDKNKQFVINNISKTIPCDVNPGDSIIVHIVYNPQIEKQDEDSLVFEANCLSYRTHLSGTGVFPHISIEDWDAGLLEVGKKRCLEDQNGYGLRIENKGNDTLIITNFEGIKLPFTISSPTVPTFPIIIPPLEIVYVQSACFTPLDSGSFTCDVIAVSNALDADTISHWKAKAFKKGIAVEDGIIQNNEVIIQPNPSINGTVSISFNTDFPESSLLELYDITGKKITTIAQTGLNRGFNKIQFSTLNLDNGIYFIRLKIKDKEISSRLVVIN
jgi:hypothetical protein